MLSEVTVDRRAGTNLAGQGDSNPAGLIEIPTRGSHLGQRSSDRIVKAGHMTASDYRFRSKISLPSGGHPHMTRGPSAHGLDPWASTNFLKRFVDPRAKLEGSAG